MYIALLRSLVASFCNNFSLELPEQPNLFFASFLLILEKFYLLAQLPSALTTPLAVQSSGLDPQSSKSSGIMIRLLCFLFMPSLCLSGLSSSGSVFLHLPVTQRASYNSSKFPTGKKLVCHWLDGPVVQAKNLYWEECPCSSLNLQVHISSILLIEGVCSRFYSSFRCFLATRRSSTIFKEFFLSRL